LRSTLRASVDHQRWHRIQLPPSVSARTVSKPITITWIVSSPVIPPPPLLLRPLPLPLPRSSTLVLLPLLLPLRRRKPVSLTVLLGGLLATMSVRPQSPTQRISKVTPASLLPARRVCGCMVWCGVVCVLHCMAEWVHAYVYMRVYMCVCVCA
jgi:hypothetical protein